MALSDLSQPQAFTIFIKFVWPLLIAIDCCLHNYPPPGGCPAQKKHPWPPGVHWFSSELYSYAQHNNTTHPARQFVVFPESVLMLSWLRPCARSMSVVIASDQTSTPQELANTRDECGSATLVKMVGAGTGVSRANRFPSLNKCNQNTLADKGESSAANIGPVHS
jgi:hypothetical protein